MNKKSTEPYLIQLDNLHKSFGNIKAVDGIS